MKRRSFIEKFGTGASAVLLGPHKLWPRQKQVTDSYSYAKPQNFSEIISKENQVVIRFEVHATSSIIPLVAQFKFNISKGKLQRRKHYFFDNDEELKYSKDGVASFLVNQAYPRIIVAWISNPSKETAINLFLNGKKTSFTLNDLITKQEMEFSSDGVKTTTNYLLDREIAFIKPEELSINTHNGPFSIAIMADTQGGDPATPKAHPTRVKIHNAFNEDSILVLNGLKPRPVFTLILGDVVDNQGEMQHFEAMHNYFKEIKTPILYAVGNHETIYQAKFTPGYNMEEFNNYFAAQKSINGSELLLYSFNLGQWHFVVWPDPLRANFWETHPHYFDWLERDLEQHKDMPVIFMQHVPSHPIGIDPLINYVESVYVKRNLLNILSRQGNVKYVFSGHVHIPIRASFKTAVEYKGMKMINLPAAGYRPRGFGEEEWHGGPSQGVLVAELDGTDSKIYFKTVTEEVYAYPDVLPPFDENEYPLWLSYKWQLPAENKFRNGNFTLGLQNWAKRFVYKEDKEPSNIMEVRQIAGKDCLYLYSRKRDYDTPGQDRLPQTINHLCQAIKVEGLPVNILLDYMVDVGNSSDAGYSGAFIWIEGFKNNFKLLNMAYWLGRAYGSLSDRFTDSRQVPLLHFHLPENKGHWCNARLNLQKDMESYDQRYEDLRPDTLVINIGTWTINDGGSYPYAVYVTDVRIEKPDVQMLSNVNGMPVKKTAGEEIWWMRNNHIAGEHKYHSPTKILQE